MNNIKENKILSENQKQDILLGVDCNALAAKPPQTGDPATGIPHAVQ